MLLSALTKGGAMDEQTIAGDTTLGQALARYLEVARVEIQNQKLAARPREDSRLAVLLSEDQILLRAVEYGEQGQDFRNLVREAALLYHPESPAKSSSSKLMRQVAEFFRLSGIYCDLFDGQRAQADELFARFQAAFEAKTQTITHYAPIEWVYFGKETIQFGEFEIRRLSVAEMETIFRDRICRAFYHWARLSTEELAGYWFLIAKETVPVDPPGSTTMRLNFRVDPHRSRFSTPIDRALSLLALADWSTRHSAPSGEAGGPAKPDTLEWPLPQLVPFVVSVSDHLLGSPRVAPDTALLNRVDETDPETGEVYGQPNFQIHWDIDEAGAFERLLAGACDRLKGIRPHANQWRYMQVALHFLGRAFTSEGIESLLWNMTAVDALLGDDKSGIKKRLSARVGRILGESEREKCMTLYGIRSDLVHGNTEFKSDLHLGHLGAAREMARLVTLWTLRYLECVAEAVQESKCPVLSRADLLAILDGDVGVRSTHAVVAEALPREFPKVRDWLDSPRSQGWST